MGQNRDRVLVMSVDEEEVSYSRKTTKRTRQGGVKPVIKEKFLNASQNREPLLPMNDKQDEYIKAIKNESLVICIGVWGSSKSFIPAVMAADMLLDKKIEKLIIARPNEGKGKSLGFLKGSKDEKLECWVAPITDTLKKRLGVAHYDAFIANGKIELLNLEAIKGRSWDNTLVLCDEAEDLDPAVAKSLVGRQGINSKTIITGDIRQQDLKRESGLEYLLNVAKYANLPITLIDFDSWDYCVRSEEAKMWGQAFEAYEQRK